MNAAMPDPETMVVKGGIVVLAFLQVLRMIVCEVRTLKDELRRKPRRR